MKQIVVALLAMIMFVGCGAIAGDGKVTFETKIVHPDGWSWEQKISGSSQAVIDSAEQLFDGQLNIDTKKGTVDLYINSVQEAEKIETQESVVMKQLLGEILLGLIQNPLVK